MVSVTLSDPAIKDIDEISNYIARDNQKIAKIFVQNLFKKIDLLKNYPELGKITEVSYQSNIRTLLHKNYRIIYRFEKNVVEILRIIHTSRIFERF
jgi:toxin ParE1/3/4